MLKLRNGVLLFSMLSLMSCMEEDLSKISDKVNVSPDFALPLVKSTTTLGDLLPDDENIETLSDSSIRIYFKGDNIAQIKSDDLLEIDSPKKTDKNIEVGSINLPDFDQTQKILLSELGQNIADPSIAAEIQNAFTIAEVNGNKAPFPDIARQSGGSYDQSSSDDFLYVTMSEGELSLEVQNNTGLDIDYLKLQLKNNNPNNASSIGDFEFQNITKEASQTKSLPLDTIQMYKDISFEVVAIEITGSGPNVNDPSTYINLEDDDNILLSIVGSNISVTKGKVKFPDQKGPSDDFTFDMDFDDDVSIDYINLSGGAMEYSYESSVNTTLELDMEIPQLRDPEGNYFKKVLMISNTSGNVVDNSIDLTGYQFIFEEGENQLEIKYASKITETPGYANFNEKDFVSLSIGMADLEFSEIKGYFGQITEDIEPGELDIDVSVLEDFTSGLEFMTPELTFTIDNSIGIPFKIDMDLTGSNGTESESLTDVSIDVDSDSDSSFVFNEKNNLSKLIQLGPEVLSYKGSVVSNPDNPIQNSESERNLIKSGTEISIGYEMSLPLYLKIDNAVSKDTLSYDFSDSDDFASDDVEAFSLKLNLVNEFPLDVRLSIEFVDSLSGSVLDSLDRYLLRAAAVDENGITNNPSVYSLDIDLDSNQIDALFNGNQLIFEINLNSSKDRGVRLYTDYTIQINAGVRVKSKIEE